MLFVSINMALKYAFLLLLLIIIINCKRLFTKTLRCSWIKIIIKKKCVCHFDNTWQLKYILTHITDLTHQNQNAPFLYDYLYLSTCVTIEMVSTLICSSLAILNPFNSWIIISFQGRLTSFISKGLKIPGQLDCLLLTATVTGVPDTDFFVCLEIVWIKHNNL